jgi:hypothetical protein
MSHSRETSTVLFTIDTEPDNQWANHRNTRVENVAHLPRLQRLFDDMNVTPTYLITYAVASDPDAVRTLQSLVRESDCEIGAHLHAWDNPPFLPGGADREHPAFTHDLPVELVHEKLAALTERIAADFDAPRSYRAGRFGFCADHIRVLESLGYIVDTSVTPLIDRSAKEGIPRAHGGRGGRDYRSAPLDPYHPDYANDLRLGSARLLEVPLTAAPSRCGCRAALAVHRRGPELANRALRKLGVSEVVSASPVHFGVEALQAMLASAWAAGRRVFNFTLHSSEAMPGGSPLIRTEDHLEELFRRIRASVAWLQARGAVRSMGISEFATGFNGARRAVLAGEMYP